MQGTLTHQGLDARFEDLAQEIGCDFSPTKSKLSVRPPRPNQPGQLLPVLVLLKEKSMGVCVVQLSEKLNVLEAFVGINKSS